MILLTGATGTLGRPLLSRLVGSGADVRALVREPRRLGPARVQVQIAIGNLSDHHSFARAVRGVDTVIHLGATTRDQTRGSIEEINGIGTARLVNAAQRAGVERFVYVSSIGASVNAASRFIRTQALARDAVIAGGFESLIFDASVIYAPNDSWISLLRKLSLLPMMPVPGDGTAEFQPIWAEDAADAIMAAVLMSDDPGTELPGLAGPGTRSHVTELVGPDVLTHDEMLRTVLHAIGRPRPLWHLSPKRARKLLRLQEWYLGPAAVATWDQAQLMSYSSVATRGTDDVNALGVQPLSMHDVLAD
ncbi:MAG: NAD(P)H-binding protein [Solirubrobacterales bacterium]